MDSRKLKKILTVIFLVFVLLGIIFLSRSDEEYKVEEVKSPNDIILNNTNHFSYEGYGTFDSFYSEKNQKLAKDFGLTQDEAFILGNFGKYWAKGILDSRSVRIIDGDLVYYKFGYRTRFENSPYCIKDGKMCNTKAFERQLKTIRRGKFVIVDTDNDTIYPVSKESAEAVKNYVVVRRTHVKHLLLKEKLQKAICNNVFTSGNIKIILSDLTTKLAPDRNCSSDICREFLKNINSTQKSLDIAIYGYSSTPALEKAIQSAVKRGVKVRLVYDSDASGSNIYPETADFVKIIPNNRSDKESAESKTTMHNKFCIFDSKIVITGSANFSHTDMSGFNSNSIVVINSPEVAKYYTQEFEQMYSGKFHNAKISTQNKKFGNIQVFFSPQDRPIKTAVIPMIKDAKKYIYIPAFVITEKRMAEELINAKNRGIDVKIIADALNSSNKYSQIPQLRKSDIQVKTENYAGKMHAKTIIIDDELIMGSMNFSKNGEYRNDENMVIINNPKAAEFYKKFFLYQWEKIPNKWLKYTPKAESKDSIGSCSDGIDNNYDGFIDSEDSACK